MPIRLPSFRSRKESYPADLWTKCPSCEELLFNKQLEKQGRVCPNCGHHFRLSAAARLDLLLDPGSWDERDAGLVSVDPLGFVDQKPYPDRVAAAQVATGLRDAAVWGFGRIDGTRVAICVMDFGFMGGSMGAVVGEKVTRAAEAALGERVPLIVVSASGGARMQEGTYALMQLAKTVAALERLRAAAVPYLSVMTDPTTGGVFASYAALGDVNIAEPNALIGFAGARVAAGTIATELPAGFQRAEFLFQHGFVDRVVPRDELRNEVALLLRFLVPPDAQAAEQDAVGAAERVFRPFSRLGGLMDLMLAEEPPAAPARKPARDRTAEDPIQQPDPGPAAAGPTMSVDGSAAEPITTAVPATTADPPAPAEVAASTGDQEGDRG